MRRFDINKNDGEQRLDKFITKTAWGLPNSLMYKYIRTKRIKVNGKRAKENQILSVGDVVEMYIPEEFFAKNTAASEYFTAKIKLDVAYEDENILICDKRPGVLVHPGDEGDPSLSPDAERNTLIFAVKAYLAQKGEYDPDNENSFAPALCNRIDRNTGGLVIAAKNAEALRAVNEIIRERKLEKLYYCAVHGAPVPSAATLRGYLFKNTKTKTVRIEKTKSPGAKEAITEYRTLAYNKTYDISLLEVCLHTGRTHQIRAHMASIAHPLLGEGKYGNNQRDRELGFRHQALYSYRMRFMENDGYLSYLGGMTVTALSDNIKFLGLFNGCEINKNEK